MTNYTMIASAAPPSGGRFPLSPRFMRNFHILCVPEANDEIIDKIFLGIVDGFLKGMNFNDSIIKCGSVAVSSTIEMYNNITKGLLPIPSKFHYTFNLRDISKVF